jgi:hypothetical protein
MRAIDSTGSASRSTKKRKRGYVQVAQAILRAWTRGLAIGDPISHRFGCEDHTGPTPGHISILASHSKNAGPTPRPVYF